MPMHLLVSISVAITRALRIAGWWAAGLLSVAAVGAAAGRAELGAGGRAAEFWRGSIAELEAFAPDCVADELGGRLWFRGWHDQMLEAKWWAGDGALPCVVAAASVPEGWEPPADGRTWLVLRPKAWTVEGLPDARGYWLREQALAIAQARRAVERLYGRAVRTILMAEGLSCVAALGVACAEPEKVVGAVLLAPRPYRHFDGETVSLGGREAEELGRLARERPEWAEDLRRATGLYDIAVVGPIVKVPVLAIGDVCWWPAWLDWAAEKGRWYCIGVDVREPSLERLSEASWFGELWAECMAALGQGGDTVACR